jgi:hypothetical protein
MKQAGSSKRRPKASEELRPEYELDYRKARPNRFAGRLDPKRCVVVLDPDVVRVFTTPESVNAALRALIEVVPQRPRRPRRPSESSPTGPQVQSTE